MICPELKQKKGNTSKFDGPLLSDETKNVHHRDQQLLAHRFCFDFERRGNSTMKSKLKSRVIMFSK